MRLALGALIEEEPSLELAAVAADADEMIEIAGRAQPDVCIVDVSMPAGGGPRATSVIRERWPAMRVIALSGHDDRETVLEMLRSGASGYLVKGGELLELVDAVHAAVRGEGRFSNAVMNGVVGELTDKLAREERERAIARERDTRIARVLSGGVLETALQPIVDLTTRRTIAYESLARFASQPVRSPQVWFAEAARSDRLQELELAAVASALAQLHRLPPGVSLSVNASPATAGSDALLAAVPTEDVGRRLIVEVTEHAPIDDYDALSLRLERLRERGVRIAVDDAGAGFASLRHILRLAPSIIKIDMALTRRIERDRAERAMTRALISFADEIGAAVVAEGVESEAEVDALAGLGVHLGQGFHLGRPSPPDAYLARTGRRLEPRTARAA